MKLKTDRNITAEEILKAVIDDLGVKIFKIPGQIDFFVRVSDNIIHATPDELGVCSFFVPDSAKIPVHFMDWMLHQFDCIVERDTGKPFSITDLEMHDSIAEVLGELHLTRSDNIIRCVRGKSHEFRSEEDLEKAEIASSLVVSNPDLTTNGNIETLLTMTDAIYLQRNPPFKLFVSTKDPRSIEAYIGLLLNWAGTHVDASQAEKIE